MKKQSVVLAAVSILLLSSCQKSADEVVPSSSGTSTASEMTGTNGKNNQCNGQKPQGPPPPPEKVMQDLDLDKDGSISKTEAKGPLAQDFDKIDTDLNGLISLEELKSAAPPAPPQSN